MGSLLAHESSLDGYTIIVATFDSERREIVTHALCLPSGLGTRMEEAEVDEWFDRQRELICKQHGPLLSSTAESTTKVDYPCPDCGDLLRLRIDGDWLA
ncbi:MAG: hypothetical protein AAF664_09925 [Planctomycetota bacterium]